MKRKALSLIAAAVMAIAAIPAHAGFIVKTAAAATTTAASTANACTDMNAVAGTTASADFSAKAEAAKAEFKNLSRSERRARIHAVKDQIKAWKASDHHGDTNTILYVILAILLPPLAVGLYDGGLSTRFWLDLLLTLIFWIPGVIYALIVILS